MSFKGFIKHKVLNKKKRIITEDYFCNKLRNNEQDKLISKIKYLNIDVSKLKLNWNYISLNDNLTIKFISYFKDYINFHDLSLNKNLTTKHLDKFKDDLEWDILSEYYNFTLDDLHIYKNYINWRYIFFYKNTPSEIIKEDFYKKMWWLFLDDQIYNQNDIEYGKYNDMIINKNMHTIPKPLIDRFEYTLLEYKRNKIIMKDVLKIQLNKLYKEFIDNKTVLDLKKIDCNLFRVEHKNQEVQSDKNIKIKITCEQSTQTNKVNTKSIQTQEVYNQKKMIQTEKINLEYSDDVSISINKKNVEEKLIQTNNFNHKCLVEMKNIQEEIINDLCEDIIEEIVIDL